MSLQEYTVHVMFEHRCCVSVSLLVLQKETHNQQLMRIRASSAKSQAESALSVFELREENHRLAKENSKLLGKSALHTVI